MERFNGDEVIKILGLKSRAEFADDGRDFDVACRIAINMIQKAQHYEDLAEQGRLVELPCKVGDTVYIMGQCNDFPPQLDGSLYDSDGGFGSATGYYCPYEQSCPFDTDDCNEVKDKKAIFEDTVVHICIEEDNTWYVCENYNGFNNNSFGKTIFATKSEAEQALAERK